MSSAALTAPHQGLKVFHLYLPGRATRSVCLAFGTGPTVAADIHLHPVWRSPSL